MAPIIPPLGQVRKIGVCDVMGPVSPLSARRLFMLQRSIDASAPNPDHLCDVFYSVASTIQLPSLSMATHALCIAAFAFLFEVLRHCCLRWRKCFPSKLLCCLFEHSLVVTKELLQGFGEILL
jgi:hypothetical protein